MKSSNLILTTAVLIFSSISIQLAADETTKNEVAEEFNAEAVAKAKDDISLKVERLLVISNMDIESLNKSEKKELRKEVRSIRKDLKAYSNSNSEAIAEAAAKGSDSAGIYISGGAIIVILLLLLLL
jgi:F0F1-type ATP synthase membrane subunit b/b'